MNFSCKLLVLSRAILEILFGCHRDDGRKHGKQLPRSTSTFVQLLSTLNALCSGTLGGALLLGACHKTSNRTHSVHRELHQCAADIFAEHVSTFTCFIEESTVFSVDPYTALLNVSADDGTDKALENVFQMHKNFHWYREE